MPLPFYRERHFYLCITCPCHRHRCMSHYHFDLRQLLPDLRLLLGRLRSAFLLTLLDSQNGTGTSVSNAGIFDAFSSFSAKGVRHLRPHGMFFGVFPSNSSRWGQALLQNGGLHHPQQMVPDPIAMTPLTDQLP